MTSERFDELESLLLDWEEGTLDEAGVERLREILRTDQDSRAHYVRLQMMTAAMSLDGQAGVDAFPADKEAGGWFEQVPQRIRTITAASLARRGRWMLVAATLLIGVLAGRLVQLELADRDPALNEDGRPGSHLVARNERDESEEATSQGVALITRLVDVTWKAGQLPLEVGDALPPGPFDQAVRRDAQYELGFD